jgi:hypothetical protein
MKREDLRCPECNTVYLTLEYGDGAITATHYSGGKLLHSDGDGNTSAHAIHRREHTLDVLEELRDGGLPNISVECRCRVHHINLHDAIGKLYRR